jgi:hypothetical protein
MENVDPGKGVKSEGDSGCEEESQEGSKVKNPYVAPWPCPSLDIHDCPGDKKAKEEAHKCN